jgi:hypothetical protein
MANVTIKDIEIYTSRRELARFIMPFGDDPKSKYLYAFEAEIDRLTCAANFHDYEPFAAYGERGFVTQLFSQGPGLKDGMWCNAHMYYGLGKPVAEGALKWFNECCLPVIKRSRPVPEQKKLKEAFNIFPGDGGPDNLVVGVGFSTYRNTDALTVILIYANGKGRPISVNLTDFADDLEEGEFFFKDWSDQKHIAERCIEVGLVQLVDKPRVQSGHVAVPIAKLNHGLLTEFSAAEAARYKP